MYLKPKKSLGQNFLVDKNILQKIVAACSINYDDQVLEIGPGRGELTGLLVQQAAKVIAFEIDRGLYEILLNTFTGVDNLRIVRQDILKADLGSYLGDSGKFRVIANIPYYITTQINELIVKNRNLIDSAYLTVQKEFAERMVAVSGSKVFGSFSCFVQYYTEPEILFKIKKTSFRPVPKVDSCLLKLKLRKEMLLGEAEEKKLFRITRTAFNQRRKTLRNSLEGVVAKDKLEHFFSAFHIDENTRPESLSLADFINLAKL